MTIPQDGKNSSEVAPAAAPPVSFGPVSGSSKLPAQADQGSPSLLAVSIDGKPAHVGHDHEFLFVVRGHSNPSLSDPHSAHLRVPTALVLDASFVADSDGGSLLVRLLSPPLQKNDSSTGGGFSLFKKARRPPECMEPMSMDAFGKLDAKERAERLREQLEGPCSNLRLVKIEARVLSSKDGQDVETKAHQWVDDVLAQAYRDTEPYRRLKILINPVGGPGKGRQLFDSRVRPILEAAGCKLDVTITAHRMHGFDVAKDLRIQDYDAVGLVSGDGLLHELLNGLASRPDSREALRLPVAPIPAGSGNAMAINLLGPDHGFSLALACLNLVKGKALELDLLSVTQPASAFPPGVPIPGTSLADKTSQNGTINSRALDPMRGSEDVAQLIDAPSKPYVQYYSFLSQTIGIMADLDLGTENLRALGDTRFLIGYATAVLRNTECEVDIDVKLGTKGTKNKAEMRGRVAKFYEASQTQASDEVGGALAKASITDEDAPAQHSPPSASSSLLHGPVTEPLTDDGSAPPAFDLSDPSWPHSILKPSAAETSTSTSSSGWYRMQEAVSSLYAGKLPFVARDLMQFPYALPHDGTIDVSTILHAGGRTSKVPETGYAETGQVVYQKAMTYVKVEALRVTPRRKEGDKKLRLGGLISIDGEKVPYAPFQVEVAQGLQYRVLTLYGRFCVPVVQPPSV
ncbi:hypothetical protein BCV70DRAFT_202377 [Testicularia cyperi]|uniref:DAGKc domain-containing protein n=1 Tax=Testicularia cyperi TaxID=1882483 RepID=A0A317XI87_9BASI|nr:hypothetical protein BCV70DRAFT_202377 [Testicularia cyperi]